MKRVVLIGVLAALIWWTGGFGLLALLGSLGHMLAAAGSSLTELVVAALFVAALIVSPTFRGVCRGLLGVLGIIVVGLLLLGGSRSDASPAMTLDLLDD